MSGLWDQHALQALRLIKQLTCCVVYLQLLISCHPLRAVPCAGLLCRPRCCARCVSGMHQCIMLSTHTLC
jgi:hypothetical protein